MLRGAAVLAACVLGWAVVAPAWLSAQDTHYWSESYGTQARLLGGTVIGSDADISAVYYNPGAIALADSLEFLISLSGLRYSRLGYKVPTVTKLPPGSGWSSVSNMVAGVIPIGGAQSRSRMAYSILTRQAFSFGAQIRALPLDSFPQAPPPPTVSIGNAVASQSLGETWSGVSYSYKYSEHWGFGASLYAAVRSQTFSKGVSAQVVNGDGATALGQAEYDFSYSHWGLLVKAGPQYRGQGWTAGVTLTSPRLKITGSGDVGATRSYVNEGVTSAGGSSSIGTTFQPGLPATYHSPASIGAGLGRQWKNTGVAISAEWFAAVPAFTILPAEAFTPQSGGDTVSVALNAKYRQVFNWGVGVRHRFNPKLSLYGAYRTDNTNAPSDTQPQGSLVFWDLQHANLGVQFGLGRAAIILGLDGAWGKRPDVSSAIDSPPGLPTLPPVAEAFASLTGALGFKLAY